MPRSPSPPFNWAAPTGTTAVSGQVISSVAYNNFLSDLTTTLNGAYPVAYGGTGTTDGSALVPDGSAATPGVRFQSETNTGFYRVTAGTIGISIAGTSVGTITAAGLSIPLSSTSTIVSTGSTVGYVAFQGVSTEAAAAAGPIIDLYRNSVSPAANDLVGQLIFTAQNSTPAKKTYTSITTRLDTITAGTEAATMRIATMLAGTVTNYLTPGANAAGTATANAVGLPLGQLSFPATQNASSDVNTLDDYSEGSWTPTLTFGGLSTGITFSAQSGRYVKIGKLVFIEFNILLSSKGSATGGAKIAGFPFTSDSASGGSFGPVTWVSFSSITSPPFARIDSNATTATLLYGTTGANQPADTNFGATTQLALAGVYQSAA